MTENARKGVTGAELKLMLQHVAVGFGLGLVVTLAVSYGASTLSRATPAASAATR